jgi:hypothetical protein
MRNSQKYYKKRGGAGEVPDAMPPAMPEAMPQAIPDANAMPPANAPVDPKCCPCPTEPPIEEKKSIAEKSENFVQEKQAAAVAAVTGQIDGAKAAVTDKAQGFVASLNKMVGNEPAPAVGGGRKRTKRSKSKRTQKHKRSNHKRSKSKRTKRSKSKRTKKSKRSKRSKSKRT